MTELFSNLEESLSPRLKWIQKHRVELDDPRPLSSEPHRAFIIFNPMDAQLGINGLILSGLRGTSFHDGYGQTEDEALTALAVEAGIPLWNEETAHPSTPPPPAIQP